MAASFGMASGTDAVRRAGGAGQPGSGKAATGGLGLQALITTGSLDSSEAALQARSAKEQAK
jgi:hypothetical protein